MRLKELLEIRKNAENKSDLINPSKLNVHIPEATEFEYLRNILFEYMMGREPVTLTKVISAVLRFNQDQTDEILRRLDTHSNPIRTLQP